MFSRLVDTTLYKMNNHNKIIMNDKEIILQEQIAVSSLHLEKAYLEKVPRLH